MSNEESVPVVTKGWLLGVLVSVLMVALVAGLGTAQRSIDQCRLEVNALRTSQEELERRFSEYRAKHAGEAQIGYERIAKLEARLEAIEGHRGR